MAGVGDSARCRRIHGYANTQEIFYALKAEQGRGENRSPAKLAEWLHVINRNLKRNYSVKKLLSALPTLGLRFRVKLHADWWQARIARQKEIDASSLRKQSSNTSTTSPTTDNKTVRVAGPFTVESLSPHRVLGVDENDELIDSLKEAERRIRSQAVLPQMILENLDRRRAAGAQGGQDHLHRAHRLARCIWSAAKAVTWKATPRSAPLSSSVPSCSTVQRADLVAAAREAGDAGFDVLIACAFNYEAHTTEFRNLGRIPVLKARMNADLHMAEDLKNTGKGNLFVIFGEPDIELIPEKDGKLRVKVKGVDVFKPRDR